MISSLGHQNSISMSVTMMWAAVLAVLIAGGQKPFTAVDAQVITSSSLPASSSVTSAPPVSTSTSTKISSQPAPTSSTVSQSTSQRVTTTSSTASSKASTSSSSSTSTSSSTTVTAGAAAPTAATQRFGLSGALLIPSLSKVFYMGGSDAVTGAIQPPVALDLSATFNTASPPWYQASSVAAMTTNLTTGGSSYGCSFAVTNSVLTGKLSATGTSIVSLFGITPNGTSAYGQAMSADAISFDPVANTLAYSSPQSQSPASRFAAACAMYDSQTAFVHGGSTSAADQSQTVSDTWYLDLALAFTGSASAWYVPDILAGRNAKHPPSTFGHAAALGYDKSMYIVGGSIYNGSTVLDADMSQMWVFSSDVGYTPVPLTSDSQDFPGGRRFHSLVAVGESLLMYGGISSDGLTVYSDLWLLDINNRAWFRLPDSNAPRHSHTTVVAGGNALVVAFGTNGNTTLVSALGQPVEPTALPLVHVYVPGAKARDPGIWMTQFPQSAVITKGTTITAGNPLPSHTGGALGGQGGQGQGGQGAVPQWVILMSIGLGALLILVGLVVAWVLVGRQARKHSGEDRDVKHRHRDDMTSPYPPPMRGSGDISGSGNNTFERNRSADRKRYFFPMARPSVDAAPPLTVAGRVPGGKIGQMLGVAPEKKGLPTLMEQQQQLQQQHVVDQDGVYLASVADTPLAVNTMNQMIYHGDLGLTQIHQQQQTYEQSTPVIHVSPNMDTFSEASVAMSDVGSTVPEYAEYIPPTVKNTPRKESIRILKKSETNMKRMSILSARLNTKNLDELARIGNDGDLGVAQTGTPQTATAGELLPWELPGMGTQKRQVSRPVSMVASQAGGIEGTVGLLKPSYSAVDIQGLQVPAVSSGGSDSNNSPAGTPLVGPSPSNGESLRPVKSRITLPGLMVDLPEEVVGTGISGTTTATAAMAQRPVSIMNMPPPPPPSILMYHPGLAPTPGQPQSPMYEGMPPVFPIQLQQHHLMTAQALSATPSLTATSLTSQPFVHMSPATTSSLMGMNATNQKGDGASSDGGDNSVRMSSSVSGSASDESGPSGYPSGQQQQHGSLPHHLQHHQLHQYNPNLTHHHQYPQQQHPHSSMIYPTLSSPISMTSSDNNATMASSSPTQTPSKFSTMKAPPPVIGGGSGVVGVMAPIVPPPEFLAGIYTLARSGGERGSIAAATTAVAAVAESVRSDDGNASNGSQTRGEAGTSVDGSHGDSFGEREPLN